MSQSLLYHALGIQGVSYRSTHVLGNAFVFSVETTNRHVVCQTCGHRYCQFKGRAGSLVPHGAGRPQTGVAASDHAPIAMCAVRVPLVAASAVCQR